MKRTVLLLAFGLLFAHSLAAQATDAQPCDPRIVPANSLSSGDIQLVALNENVAIEKLKGKAALAHLQNLLSRKPGAFAAAKKSLKDRGFEPTETVYVERTLRHARNSGPQGNPTPMFAQDYSESNSDGEIVFWSWDDGDNATWEGAIYVEIYSANAASTWEGQIDDSTSSHPWVYYEKTWQGGAAANRSRSMGHHAQVFLGRPYPQCLPAVAPGCKARSCQPAFIRGQFAGEAPWSQAAPPRRSAADGVVPPGQAVSALGV